MAANNNPIFLKIPKSGWATLSTTVVDPTGVDANTKVLFTADPTNGSKVEDVFIQVTLGGSTAGNIRFWMNNGSSAGTASNNSLIHEEFLPAVSISSTTQNAYVRWPANVVLPAGYRLLVASTCATTNFQVTAVGGDY